MFKNCIFTLAAFCCIIITTFGQDLTCPSDKQCMNGGKLRCTYDCSKARPGRTCHCACPKNYHGDLCENKRDSCAGTTYPIVPSTTLPPAMRTSPTDVITSSTTASTPPPISNATETTTPLLSSTERTTPLISTTIELTVSTTMQEAMTSSEQVTTSLAASTTTSTTDAGVTSPEKPLCAAEPGDMLVGGYALAGDNYLVHADGTVQTVRLQSLVFRLARARNLIFYSTGPYHSLWRLDWCTKQETEIASLASDQWAMGVAVDDVIDRVFLAGYYESVRGFNFDGGAEEIVASSRYTLGLTADTIKKILYMTDSDSSSLTAVSYDKSSSLTDEDISKTFSSRPQGMFMDSLGIWLYGVLANGDIWRLHQSYPDVSGAEPYISGPSDPVSVRSLVLYNGHFFYTNDLNNTIYSVTPETDATIFTEAFIGSGPHGLIVFDTDLVPDVTETTSMIYGGSTEEATNEITTTWVSTTEQQSVSNEGESTTDQVTFSTEGESTTYQVTTSTEEESTTGQVTTSTVGESTTGQVTTSTVGESTTGEATTSTEGESTTGHVTTSTEGESTTETKSTTSGMEESTAAAGGSTTEGAALPPSSSQPTCRVAEPGDMLVSGYSQGGNNYLVHADGSVETIPLQGLVYRLAGTEEAIFFTDGPNHKLWKLDWCSKEETEIASLSSWTMGVAVDGVIDRVFVAVYYDSIYSYEFDGGDERTIGSSAYTIALATDTIRRILYAVDYDRRSLTAISYGNLESRTAESEIEITTFAARPEGMFADMNSGWLYGVLLNGDIWRLHLATADVNGTQHYIDGPGFAIEAQALVMFDGTFFYTDDKNNTIFTVSNASKPTQFTDDPIGSAPFAMILLADSGATPIVEPTTEEPSAEPVCAAGEPGELLVGGYSLGGDNFRVFPNGSVDTVRLSGSVYRLARAGSWIFFSDGPYMQLWKLDWCSKTDTSIATLNGWTLGVAADDVIKRVFVAVYYQSIYSYDYDGGNEKIIGNGYYSLGLATDPSRSILYSADYDGKTLQAINYADLDNPSSEATITTFTSRPEGLFADVVGDFMYGLLVTGDIWQMNLGTGNLTKDYILGPPPPVQAQALVVYNDQFFYTDDSNDTIYSVSVSGSPSILTQEYIGSAPYGMVLLAP